MLAATTRARQCLEQKGCGCRSTRRASSQELSKRLGSLLNGSLRWEKDGHAKKVECRICSCGKGMDEGRNWASQK